ncbi:hypothetical protein IMF23_10955 [Chelatococcus daeguensis]|uniref:hypothetical protein n=1 Tax=Chelatococcus daeguensis TaxID=444444 RepID=UPI0007AB9179|nr:hypothetical protein [Chelatococcus daeguensis]KZE29233.1 hypothetical protein AVW15_05385 [Chelatococcus daeguensis]MBM3083953.1 hypothetical protein [Chelatococcus daeguensis]
MRVLFVAGALALTLAACQTAQESAVDAEFTCREAGLRPGTRSYDRCVNAAYNSNRRQADQAASQVAVGTAAALVGGAVLGAATAPRGYYYRCNAWGCW